MQTSSCDRRRRNKLGNQSRSDSTKMQNAQQSTSCYSIPLGRKLKKQRITTTRTWLRDRKRKSPTQGILLCPTNLAKISVLQGNQNETRADYMPYTGVHARTAVVTSSASQTRENPPKTTLTRSTARPVAVHPVESAMDRAMGSCRLQRLLPLL